jgi:hypothetical protein
MQVISKQAAALSMHANIKSWFEPILLNVEDHSFNNIPLRLKVVLVPLMLDSTDYRRGTSPDYFPVRFDKISLVGLKTG